MYRSPTLQTLTYFAYALQNFKYVFDSGRHLGVDAYMMLMANRHKVGDSHRNGFLSPSTLELVNKMTYKINEKRTDGDDIATKAVTQVMS